MDIAHLSDEDLREKLQQYGLDPGPVGPTTRLFYEKKLGRLIDSGGVQNVYNTDEEEEEEEEEEVEDEEVQINYRTAPRTYTVPPPPVVSQRREPISQPVPRDYTPITKARQATVDSDVFKRLVLQTRKNKGLFGKGLIVYLLFILIVNLYCLVLRKNDGPNKSSTQKPASQPSKKSSGGSSIAFWIKLLFIIGIAFLVYLVIINMNQSAQDKIPLSHAEV